ncbi:MAG TPA: alpha/beta hydrolase [Anaerolineales bacterium]|nr:alpha/beta hydrolase [Anaerolineales bacterium]
MLSEETTIQTSDQLALYAKRWQPETPPRAAICLVHGLGEHCERYEHVAAAFNKAGFAMLGFDQRGHGRSPGPRGDTPSHEMMLKDIDRALEAAQASFPDVPLFLYGHSMGGNLVLNHILRHKPPVAGAIATSPWLRVTNPPSALLMAAARLMRRIYPKITQGNGLELEGLSRDPQVIADYQTDPLNHDRISARMAVEFSDAGEWALEHANELSIPLLLVHGSADRLTSPLASQEFAAKAGDLCTFKMWEGCYHETHNEPNKEEVIAFNIAWITERL